LNNRAHGIDKREFFRVSYAGITRIRFEEFFLSLAFPDKAPPTDIQNYKKIIKEKSEFKKYIF